MASAAHTLLRKQWCAKFVLHLGCSGNDGTTCVNVRTGALRVHRGDVALYSVDGVAIMARDVPFFATALDVKNAPL